MAFPAVYLLGSAFPPQLILMVYPRYSPPPPDKDSARGKAVTSGTERELQGLGIVEELRGKHGWYETRESYGDWGYPSSLGRCGRGY